MSTKFTHGPWNVVNEIPGFTMIGGKTEDDGKIHNAICEVYQPEKNKQSEANAKLIAAAPELLEALNEALDQLESWNNESEDTFTMKRIREAIKKATE